jgi:sulfur relay (sulfurtransferase) DsrF/TusC family protein
VRGKMTSNKRLPNGNLIIFLKSPPYSSENSFVGLSNALVDVGDSLNLIIIFIFDGVWNVIPNQNNESLSNFPNIEDLYKTIITDAEFYIYKKSLEQRNLLNSKLLPGLKLLDPRGLYEIVRTKGQNILFF